MTVYVKQMFDQLADLLEESEPASAVPGAVTWDMKRHYLNMGQNAMWPRVHNVVQDVTTELGGSYQEYILPVAVRGGRLIYVEVEGGVASGDYYTVPNEDYRIIPGPGRADILKIGHDASVEGRRVRVTSAMPLTPIVAVDDAAAATEAYTGPDFTVEGPALYAMNRLTARGLHNRLDYTRLSVQRANGAAVPNELMAVSIFWLDEFERRLDQWQLVHPQSVA